MFRAAVIFSGVCSNDGGCDLATAIDLSDKDNTRVTHGGGQGGVGSWIRPVTVRHVPVMAGETRPLRRRCSRWWRRFGFGL
ncbi:hypothetical protein Bca4012_079582 [Brassica carinata]|uniref:Uncharacterized protein n=2 Tax=Brassica TaxID=3705 RepID=A0A8X7U3C9_BRACI|nr:hypothetical protein Bca52824_070778 [Brassica carinata]CAF2018690.1 unnamed protein product [Brassica napus]CDY23002.1 BnaC07g31850D [Brassica napus]